MISVSHALMLGFQASRTCRIYSFIFSPLRAALLDINDPGVSGIRTITSGGQFQGVERERGGAEKRGWALAI